MKFKLVETLLTEGKNIEKTWEQYKDKFMKWDRGFIGKEDKAHEVFYQVLKNDPTYQEGSTTTGDYGIWLLNQFLKYNIFQVSTLSDELFTEKEVNGELLDIPIKDVLKEFIQKKSQLEKKDINQYKTTQDLIDALDNTDFSDRQKERQKRRTYKGAKQVFNGKDWEVWVPETYEASCTLGAGSGWCTADTRSRSHYDYYLGKGGKYYIIMNKKNPKEKYQFHWETKQFMGSGTNQGHTLDREYSIDKDKFLADNPELMSFFEELGYIKDWSKVEFHLTTKTDVVPKDVVTVIIDNGITEILGGTFYNCTHLKNVTIPTSVKKIEANAFFGCRSLESITIPPSCTGIGDSAFGSCTSLKSVKIPDGVTIINQAVFSHCTALESVELGNNIKEIQSEAFLFCQPLKSIHLPEGLKKIGYRAFTGCKSLSNIEIPSSCEKISDVAFANTALTSIKIPDSVTTLSAMLFEGCSQLKTVQLPSRLKAIPSRLFYECGNLESVNIPESVTKIDDDAFAGCTALKSITFPKGLEYLGKNAFWKCESLQSMVLSDVAEDRLRVSVFNSCTGLKNIVLPTNLRWMEDMCLANCTNLQQLDIPESVAIIGRHAFYGCDSLTELRIPNSVSMLSPNAFYNCLSLKKIEVPSALYNKCCEEVSHGSLDVDDDWAFLFYTGLLDDVEVVVI